MRKKEEDITFKKNMNRSLQLVVQKPSESIWRKKQDKEGRT